MTAPTPPDRLDLLARNPLFSVLDRTELERLGTLFVEASYQRGDTVCVEGEEGDTFFVCVSGELEVWGESPRRLINRIRPGDCFGEIALLVGGRRAATVTVARAARLLALDRAAFERFFLQNPKVLEYLSRVLSKRLAGMSRGEAVAPTALAIAVSGGPGQRGVTLVATTLAALLREFSGRDTILVRLHGDRAHPEAAGRLSAVADESPEGVLRRCRPTPLDLPVLALAADAPGAIERLTAALRERFAYVVLDVEPGEGIVRAAEDAAEIAVRLQPCGTAARQERPGDVLRVFEVLNLANPETAAIAVNHGEPFVIRDDPALRGRDPWAQAAHLRAHPRSPAAPGLHRLARKILGTTVGIALGGGAAFGIAHVGVLKVLEQHGIPIDLVTGCSMGSIIALGYAGGMRASEMEAIARRLGTWRTILYAVTDLTLTRPGLLSGDRIVRLLGPLTGAVRRFDQLALPCRVVAADIDTGELIAIGAGTLEDAGRASCSIPMAVAPVKLDGRVLVDGGVADPVPAQTVHEMGADVCIAVNVVPRLVKGVQTPMAAWYRRLRRFDPLTFLFGDPDLPSMFDLVMNSMQTLQYELGNFKAISADVRINPDLSGLTWTDFHKPEEFIRRGVEATELVVPEIKRVLAARLERGRPAPPELPSVGAGASAGT